MSIIYDALTKTQKNTPHSKALFLRAATLRHINWINGLLISAVIGLSILTLFTYYPKYKTLLHKPAIHPVVLTSSTPIAPQLPVEKIYRGALQLNGVFISDHEKIALINSQTHALGDMVDGKKIISIEYSGIKLQEGNTIFILTTNT